MKIKHLWFVLVLPWLGLAHSAPAAEANLATTAKPTLSITNLTAGQSLRTNVFTVQGTAKDNSGVANVFYALNQGAWTNASTANTWTNWSATVTLVPGTNTFSAYAVDNSGSHSKTNTVKFVYVVTTTITVRTNGPGKISPAYNGAQLNIGVGYSITAKGTKPGIGLVTWTDGNSNILGTTATLKFLMSSNLTLIANLGDVVLPTVNVSSTTTNTDGIPTHFVVHGVAKDNVAVANVFYRLNTGAWSNAVTGNNWTNWTADVTLAPGANTFYVYSMDTTSNDSYVVSAQIDYNSAPASLSGKSARVFDMNGTALFTSAFGKNTFSQFTSDTKNVNGVGSYTYSASGGEAKLKLKYTGPPSATNQGSQTLALLFYTPSYAYFTNTTTTGNGYIQFSSVSNLALAKVSGQLIWSISSQGDGNGITFQKNTYLSQSLLSTATNAGSYTYTQYSRVGGLFKLTDTNGTSYVLADFAATNYGSYFSEDYDQSGNPNGMDNGRFLVDSQQPGGNAPLTVTNRSFQIFSAGETLNEQFGTDTFSQDTLSTNFDNAVGSYTYDRPDTNIGQINLSVTEPPTLAGSNDTARLIFFNGNSGVFTNNDGTLSSFILSPATNFVPDSIANTSLTLGFLTGFEFSTNGAFTYYQFFNAFSGNYTYTPFSPGAAMVNLTFISDTNIIGRGWLQLNFQATNSGATYWNEFDSNTNFLWSSGGSFTIP